MIRIPLIYVKDKQAFVRENGILRLLGNAVKVAQRMKKEGFILIHIVDLDALKGVETNFDVYDKLTYFINIQVECGENPDFIERLIGVKARVVVPLPSKLNLKGYGATKKLLVGKIGRDYNGNAEEVHDIILEEPTEELFLRFEKRRLIVYEDYKGKRDVWGVIFSPKP